MLVLCSVTYSWRAENPCVMPYNLVSKITKVLSIEKAFWDLHHVFHF